MGRDFNEHRLMQVIITENQLASMQMMEEVSQLVRMNYFEVLDSQYKTKLVDGFLFL